MRFKGRKINVTESLDSEGRYFTGWIDGVPVAEYCLTSHQAAAIARIIIRETVRPGWWPPRNLFALN
jgi:hypothetical protein